MKGGKQSVAREKYREAMRLRRESNRFQKGRKSREKGNQEVFLEKKVAKGMFRSDLKAGRGEVSRASENRILAGLGDKRFPGNKNRRIGRSREINLAVCRASG